MPTASLRIVSPEYFAMMKIPIRDGRVFDRRDTATSPEVVLINERAAQRFFSGQNPVGQQIRVSAELARDARNGPKTIVGVAALDPLLPLANIERLVALVDASLAGRRFTMLVLLTFAAIAVAISVIGVYGVLAYLVVQRKKEIGLRLAIGASPSDVIWLFMRKGAALTLVGLGAGLAGALAVARDLER
jgi:cell division protein FtsX